MFHVLALKDLLCRVRGWKTQICINMEITAQLYEKARGLPLLMRRKGTLVGPA